MEHIWRALRVMEWMSISLLQPQEEGVLAAYIPLHEAKMIPKKDG